MSKPSNTNHPNSSVRDSIVCPDVREQPKRDIRDIFGGYRVGEHLLPFRTEKLSPTSPMILQQVCGKVGRRQTNTKRSYFRNDLTPFFMSIQ